MSIAELSIRRPVTTIMLFVSLVVIGLIAAFRLPLEAFPEVIAAVPVRVSCRTRARRRRKSSARSLRPVEEALATMPGIKRMNSQRARRRRADVHAVHATGAATSRSPRPRRASASTRSATSCRTTCSATSCCKFSHQRPAGAAACASPARRDLTQRVRPDRPRVQAPARAHRPAWPASRSPARRRTRSRSRSTRTA